MEYMSFEDLPDRERETEYTRKKVEHLLDFLLTSKEVEDVFFMVGKEINPNDVLSKYTGSLFKLQETLNERITPGFGNSIAKDINDRLPKLDYFTAIRLIDFIKENAGKIPQDTIKALPEIIEGIKGNNGRDTNILKYRFVSKNLPQYLENDEEKLNSQKNLEECAKKYAEDNAPRLAKTNGESNSVAEKYNRVCKEVFGGDFDLMRAKFRNAIYEDLEELTRTAKNINDAQSIEPIKKE